MNKLTSILATTFTVGLLFAAVSPAQAVPIAEKDFTFKYGSGASKIDVADMSIDVYAPGADPAEDARLGLVSPAADQNVYFYKLIPLMTVDIQSLMILLPMGALTSDSDVGILTGGVPVTINLYPDAASGVETVVFQFTGGLSAFADPVDLYMLSANTPGTAGGQIFFTGSGGLTGGNLLVPKTEPIPVVPAVPEPATLLLLGSGLLGLSRLGKYRRRGHD